MTNLLESHQLRRRRPRKMNDTQIDDAIARVVGGIYIAITHAMPKENAEVAHKLLFRLADNPNLRPEVRRIYRMIADSASLIADSASRDPEQLAAENEEMNRQPYRYVRPAGRL